MPDLFRYSNSFEPLLLEGMTATLYGSDLPPTGKNVQCKAVIALPEYIKDFGALTAATWSTDQEDTNLELFTNELGQFRMRILDDLQVRLKNPAPTMQWRTSKTNFVLPQFPQGITGDEFLKNYLWKASEFFVWEDTTPRFDLYSFNTATTSKIIFSGWRIKLVTIPTKGKIEIWINEWPAGL